MAVAEARDFGFGKFRDRGSTFTDSILWTRLPVGAFLCYVNGYCSSFCCCPAGSAVTPPLSGETFRIHDRRESEKRHEILDLVGPPLHSRRILQVPLVVSSRAISGKTALISRSPPRSFPRVTAIADA